MLVFNTYFMSHKINSNILCSALSILGLLIISCRKPEPQPEAVLPTNLEVIIDILDNGLVQVEASATNANFYTITFFENSIIEEQKDTVEQIHDMLEGFDLTSSVKDPSLTEPVSLIKENELCDEDYCFM